MKPMVQEVWRYPVKGAHGFSPGCISINTEVGVMGDRQWAFAKSERKVPDNVWKPKGLFHVGMNTPMMVSQTPAIHPTSPESIDEGWARYILDKLDNPNARLVDSNRSFSYADTEGAFVSFLNLATVEELARYTGWDIDPRRFRMNVWITGLPAFQELAWVTKYPGDQKIQVGQIIFRVDDACERCKATEANPCTGEWDLEILLALSELMRERGYLSPHRQVPRVMGILAAPLSPGCIQPGDEIHF